MLVSYLWLRELLPQLDETPAGVAQRLSAAGLAVDAVKQHGKGLEPVLVAEVVAIEPHPERSGLRLVTVNQGKAQQRVVCGASNVPGPGGLVVLAPVGTTLPNGVTLATRAIGGVVSEGMLCSESELGLAEESEGILILPSGSAQPGAAFLAICPQAGDTIFELDLTPNRPDALGHVGVARELAALLELPFALPSAGAAPRTLDEPLEKYVKVVNHDVARCPHYGAALVCDVKIAPSPSWLRWRLQALGIRPISNVVDVTNLLLLQYGQPLHAFDLDHVKGGEIHVRRATPGQAFTTLDGVARVLDGDDLMICDATGPSALAGVMGGLDSEIRATTRRVLIECAYFVPSGVRRSARRHGLHTESSHRFERGVDWSQIDHVLAHARALIATLGQGQALSGSLAARGPALELPLIPLRSRRLDQLLGVAVPFESALAVLERLGLKVEATSPATGDSAGPGASAQVRGAAWRPDVRREVDLIDEVARVRGLDLIPTQLPAIAPQGPRQTGRLARAISDQAAALGLSEALTYAFVSETDLDKLHAPKPSVRLQNPLSDERNVMRTSLLPGLLEAVGRARRHGATSAGLFTLGAKFLAPGSAEPALADTGRLPREVPSFAVAITGERQQHLELSPDSVDVFDAKGLAQELIYRVCRQELELDPAPNAEATRHLHPRGAATLRVGTTRVGTLGPLHPDVVDAFELGAPVQVIELDLAALDSLGARTPKYRPIPKLPAVTRDLSLVVSDAVAAGAVEKVIKDATGDLGESVRLVTLFRGGSVPAEHRSLTFRIVYRDAGKTGEGPRTLTDKEVDARHQQVVTAAEKAFGASLRS